MTVTRTGPREFRNLHDLKTSAAFTFPDLAAQSACERGRRRALGTPAMARSGARRAFLLLLLALALGTAVWRPRPRQPPSRVPPCTEVAREAAPAAPAPPALAEAEREKVPPPPVAEYRFDFKTPESYARFRELFGAAFPSRMAMTHEQGRVVFRRDATDPSRPEGSFHIQADGLRLGRHWELRARVDLRIGVDEVEAGTRGHPYRRADFHMRFLAPGEKPRPDCESHMRFYLGVLTSYRGFFCCALRNHHQYNNSEGAGWGPLQGVDNPGPFGDAFLRRGKVREPASADGRYDVRLVFDHGEMVATLNDTLAFHTSVPPAAAQIIAESPPAFYFGCSKETTEVFLDELHLRIMPPGTEPAPKDARAQPEF